MYKIYTEINSELLGKHDTDSNIQSAYHIYVCKMVFDA